MKLISTCFDVFALDEIDKLPVLAIELGKDGGFGYLGSCFPRHRRIVAIENIIQ